MKPKYIDKSNCNALLPRQQDAPIVRQLDEYLDNTNKDNSGHEGLIDKLIKHNEQTIGKTLRLYKSPNPIDICLTVNLTSPIKVGVGCITTDRPPNEPIKLHLEFQYENGMNWKIIIPLQYLLKGWGDANDGYQCYVHVIAQNIKSVRMPTNAMTDEFFVRPDVSNLKEYYYFGITGRNWLLRFREHIGEICRGSHKKFHQAWRENLDVKDVLYTSTLMHVNLSKDEAMYWEENTIERDGTVTGSHGLNMIAGGYKGLRELHKLRIIKSMDISPEERDEAIGEYIRKHSRKGLPAPWMAEHWGIQENYLNYINKREDTLSDEQVREIRELAKMGMSAEKITEEVNARNVEQVKRILAGKTYTRVN